MPRREAKRVRVVVLPHGRDLPLPQYQTEGAAGLDLLAAIAKPLRLKPGGIALVPTGLIFQIPVGFEAQVRPRSGLAAKQGVTVLNAPGTIDSDYRGEVQVILINHGTKVVTLTRGDRIAQMVVALVTRITLQEVSAVATTTRARSGFGSTGLQGPRPSGSLPKGKSATGQRVATAHAKKARALSFPRRAVKRRPPVRR